MILWPLKGLYKAGATLLIAALFFFISMFSFFKNTEDDEFIQEAYSPEEIAMIEEYIDEDDKERRSWLDLGPEQKQALVKEANAEQAFTPELPFIPWWIRNRR